jgi:hypothetical protein
VQGLLSLQTSVVLLCLHPVAGSQLSAVQLLPSSQLTKAPLQVPLAHRSPLVHRLLSLHTTPEFCGSGAHLPVDGAQAATAQTVSFLGSQTTTLAGFTVQTAGTLALLQYSVPLHKLPSSLAVQSLSLAQGQISTAVGRHTPPLQVSPPVHGSPSSQLPPSLGVYTHPFVFSHESTVQPFLSSQTVGIPAQLPSRQPSLTVHALASSQVAACGRPTHLPVLQASAVQGLPSLQAAPSSVWPLQSSSKPLHVSGWGVAALQSVKPFAPQLLVPAQVAVVPLGSVTSTKQAVPLPAAASLQVHWPLLGTQ